MQRVNGADEPWTLGFLFDVILTRDAWMHRTDLARATQTPLDLTPEHDGVIVAGVVEEWADRHGKDFDLTLDRTGGRSLDDRCQRADDQSRRDRVLPGCVRTARHG